MTFSTSTLFILFTMTIDAMGVGLIMPVLPDLIQEVHGGDLSNAAIWGGILGSGFATMLFLFSPLIGALSDQFGRRPVLLISLGFMTLAYGLMAIAPTIWILLAGRLAGGIAAATQGTASAYMADISRPEDKARNFGLIGAGFGVGLVLGPMLGGLLAQFGTRAPFYAAGALAAANGVLGFVVLKESVTDEMRRRFEWRRSNPFGAFAAIARLPGLAPLLLIFLFYQLATLVYPVIWPFFTAERFGWSPQRIGLSLALFGAAYAVVQGALVGPVTKRLGLKQTVFLGQSLELGALLFYAFVVSGLLGMISVPVAALAAIGLPALQSIMSRNVPDNAQGELQGVLGSIGSVAMIIAPLMMTQTFAYFSGPDAPIYFPGASFLLATLLIVIAQAILIWNWNHTKVPVSEAQPSAAE